MKKLFALVLTLALLALAVCPVAMAEAEPKKVAFICKGYSDMFCLSVMEYVQAHAAEYADVFEIQYFDGETNTETHNVLIENCVTAGFDCIIFQQNDAVAPVEVVKKAVEQGVYVIVTTGHIEDDGESFYVDANPYQQGELAVKYAIDKGYLKEGTKVAIARGIDGNWHSDNRVQAFHDYIDQVGAELCASEMCNWSKNEAMTAAQNWCVAIDGLEVVLAACDDMALGVIEAIKGAGLSDQIKVFTIDGSEGGIAAVADGSLMITVQQDTEGYAVQALEIAKKCLTGQADTVENLLLDSWGITAENVADFL